MNLRRLAGLTGVFMLAALLTGCASRPQPSPERAQDTARVETPVPSLHTPEVLEEKAKEEVPEYMIISLLPPDAIPAIEDPQFLSVAEADEEYDAREPVLGVEINGDARAYSIPLLSRHEIVNDTVGGVPVAVTW